MRSPPIDTPDGELTAVSQSNRLDFPSVVSFLRWTCHDRRKRDEPSTRPVPMLPQLPSVHDVPLGSVLERVDERIAVEKPVSPGFLIEPLEGEAGGDEAEDGVVREE